MSLFTYLTRPQLPKYPLGPRDTEQEAAEHLLHCPPPSSPSSPSTSNTPPTPRSIVLRTLLVSTAIYLAALAALAYSVRHAPFVVDADEFCIGHVVQYSPLVRHVKPAWHSTRFNSSFLHENVYRQAAGDEVDAAWTALGVDYRSVVVPESEAERTGIRYDQVKMSQDYGGGFLGNVEGLHHLHCLNLLRQTLHWNYDYYLAKKEGPFMNSEYIVRIHTTHCLDILRQVLMCTPDIGILGQVWWQPKGEPSPMPFVDFNTQHRCRDYQAVREWAEEHQIAPEKNFDMDRFYEMPKPGDTIYPEIP